MTVDRQYPNRPVPTPFSWMTFEVVLRELDVARTTFGQLAERVRRSGPLGLIWNGRI